MILQLEQIYRLMNDIFKTRESLRRHLNKIDFLPVENSFPQSIIWKQNLRIEQFNKIEFYAVQNSNDKLDNSFRILNHNMRSFVTIQTYLDQIDVKEISGVFNSKSDNIWIFLKIKNLYEAGKILKDIPKFTKTDFFDSINQTKNSIYNNKYRIHYTEWDKKYFWNNPNGSHHMSIAVYQACINNYRYYIPCKICEHKINLNVANSVLKYFQIFAVRNC